MFGASRLAQKEPTTNKARMAGQIIESTQNTKMMIITDAVC